MNCDKSFKVTVNTLLNDTRLPLKTWFYAFSIISDAKKGLSAMQLQRNLNIGYPTAWKMYHKIRAIMNDENIEIVLDDRIRELKKAGIIFKRGKENPAKPDLYPKRGAGTKRPKIVGIVKRDGQVVAQVMKELGYKSSKKMVENYVDKDRSVLITDEKKDYNRMSNIIEHLKINHKKMYSYKGVNTNTIESFWAIIKRGLIGQYHQVSTKHLLKYIAEFVFKYNNRKEDEATFYILLQNALKPIN